MDACCGDTAYCGGMRVRIGFAAFSIGGVALLGAACSGSASPVSAGAGATHSELASPGQGRPMAEPSSPADVAPSVSWLRTTPEQGSPNSTVSLDVACLDNLGTVQSPVLDIGPLKGNPEGHQPWRLLGTATVRPDAVAGRYRIFTTCGASELSTDFTVVAGSPR